MVRVSIGLELGSVYNVILIVITLKQKKNEILGIYILKNSQASLGWFCIVLTPSQTIVPSLPFSPPKRSQTQSWRRLHRAWKKLKSLKKKKLIWLAAKVITTLWLAAKVITTLWLDVKSLYEKFIWLVAKLLRYILYPRVPWNIASWIPIITLFPFSLE